jgi:hypothetical protein
LLFSQISAALGGFCLKSVRDEEIARAIILSPNFSAYSMASSYRELAQRTKLDFASAIKLLDCLPVFINGDSHQRIRKAMARQLSRTKDCQFSSCSDTIENLFKFAFRRNASLDLVEDFSRPLWRAISSSIVAFNEDIVELADEIPDLFSPLLSIRERLRINERIEVLLKAHPEDEDEQLILLCLISLGARPFVGTLSLSLYEIFQANPKSRMCDLTWPEMFPSSSVRFVDRICTSQTAISDSEYHVDDRVRCVTQSKDYSSEANRKALFGYGAHTCLGKSISEKAWGLVVRTLSRSDLRAECVSITMSPHDVPFFMPSHAEIALT